MEKGKFPRLTFGRSSASKPVDRSHLNLGELPMFITKMKHETTPHTQQINKITSHRTHYREKNTKHRTAKKKNVNPTMNIARVRCLQSCKKDVSASCGLESS